MARKYFNNLGHLITATGDGLNIAFDTVLPSFSDIAGTDAVNDDTFGYQLLQGIEFEWGLATIKNDAATFDRTTVYGSSSGGSRITLAGAATIVCVPLAEDFYDMVRRSGQQLLTGGFLRDPYDNGDFNSSFTPSPLNGDLQIAANRGAHAINPPNLVSPLRAWRGAVIYTNGLGAGTMTPTGFTRVYGATPANTLSLVSVAEIFVCGGFSMFQWA